MICMFKAIHYSSLMYLIIFRICALKYMSLILLIFFCNRISMANSLKKVQSKIRLLTDISMLLMIGKGIRVGICHVTHQYAKANNKYMKDYDKNKESSYLKYWDVNN